MAMPCRVSSTAARRVGVEQSPDQVEVPLVVGVGVVGDLPSLGPVGVLVPGTHEGVAEVHLGAGPQRNRAGQVGGVVPHHRDDERSPGPVVGPRDVGLHARVRGQVADPLLGLLQPTIGDRPGVLTAEHVDVRVSGEQRREVFGQVDHGVRKSKVEGWSREGHYVVSDA
jgi:hypothetical protein